MKKFSILLIMMILSLVSCFQDIESQISIYVTNTGSSQILHIAAFDGDKILEQKSFDTTKAISGEFYVPSDVIITFVVLGENQSGLVDYYGTTIVDLTKVAISTVSISTESLQGLVNPVRYDGDGSYLSWSKVEGGTLYNIFHDYLQGDGFELIYSGIDEIYNTTLYGFEFNVYFEFADRTSILLNVPYYQI